MLTRMSPESFNNQPTTTHKQSAMNILLLVALLTVSALVTDAFAPKLAAKYQSSTKLNEVKGILKAERYNPNPNTNTNTNTKLLYSLTLVQNFNLDFSNPEIESSPLIFSEKQLREYTAEYSVDNRINPIEFILNIFKPKDETVGPALEPISYKELEEKTENYIVGKVDAKAFYAILNSAFGPKLGKVLPEILGNLPAKKAAELKKVAAAS